MMLGKDKQKPDKANKKSKRGVWQILGVLVGLIVLLYPKRKQIKEFVVKEKDRFAHIIESECRQVKKEATGFLSRFMAEVKDIFIPHPGNDHRPRALSTKALKHYAALLVAIKILVIGFLFFTYPSPAILSHKIIDEVFALTNDSRVQVGVNELAWNDYLAQAAQRKADDMVTKGYFAHIGPDGKQPWQWINQGEYRYLYMGENLAMDFTSAEIVHSAFAKSPSHWKNIINPNYQDMGIGVATGEIDGRETVVLVEFFGAQPVSASLAAATVSPAAEPAAEIPAPAVEEVVPGNTSAESEPQPELQPQPVAVSSPVSEPAGIEETVGPDITTETVAASADTVAAVEEELNREPLPQQLAAEITVPEVFTASNEMKAVAITQSDIDKGLVDYVVLFSRYLFLLFLVALMIMLMINVMVKPHIQHSVVILQTLALIVLISTFIFVRFHFLEAMPTVLIL